MNPKPDLATTVLAFNFRQVQDTTLAKAEDESGRILARAGVHITWRDCPTGNVAFPKGQGRVFFLAIKALPVLNEFLDMASGYALLPHHLAVVHYDYLPRIPSGKRGINETAMVLGCVITHELGHLLLQNSQAIQASGGGAPELVAKDGDIKAAYLRGMAHAFGSTADHDYASAAEDFRQAATAGLAEAELALGDLYEKGLAFSKITGSQ